MALAAPDSRFVGIDLSPRQIADGQSMLDQLALCHVELKALSILDVPGDLGLFDYILCHGVYSWVPPAVQEKILQICQHHLAPQGIAYISYNAYPGWHARGAIREMLCYHTERFDDPAERIRQARALLAFLATSMPARDGGYGALLRQEIATLTVTVDDPTIERVLRQLQATITQAMTEVTRSAGAAEPVPATADPNDQLLWDVRQVAKALGISQRHVYRLADAGAMPKPVHLGNLVRWNADGLRKWMEAGCPSQPRRGGA